VLIVTAEGKSVRFKESDVRPMGRNTMGVTAIKFKSQTDCVSGVGIVKNDEMKVLTLSENGFGKMSLL
jgi:DNA gyrase subunit A